MVARRRVGHDQALGLEVDQARRLWAIDADAGVAVYDLPSRRLLARFDVPSPEAHLVNDMAIAPDGSAYITDSLRTVVHRVTPQQLVGAREQGGVASLTSTFELGDVVVLFGDGMELRHGTLWVAHANPTANAISRWRVARDGSTARAERRLTDQALQLPTTLVRIAGALYVVRSQFDRGGPVGPGTPQIPFTIASVRGL